MDLKRTPIQSYEIKMDTRPEQKNTIIESNNRSEIDTRVIEQSVYDSNILNNNKLEVA